SCPVLLHRGNLTHPGKHPGNASPIADLSKKCQALRKAHACDVRIALLQSKLTQELGTFGHPPRVDKLLEKGLSFCKNRAYCCQVTLGKKAHPGQMEER